MKLFLILGNQLFDLKYIKKYSDHEFFMCEDLGLCTYEKHHKQKILFFYPVCVLMQMNLKKII